MSNTTRISFVAAALGAVALGGCHMAPSQDTSRSNVVWQNNGTPHHTHPTQEWWNYQFVFFPESQVYFEPHSETYFWFENGMWFEGSALPQHNQIKPNDNATVVKLMAERPFFQHDSVMMAFSRNRMPFMGSDTMIFDAELASRQSPAADEFMVEQNIVPETPESFVHVDTDPSLSE